MSHPRCIVIAGPNGAGTTTFEMVYLRLASPQLAVRRIVARVRQGGHNVPRDDVLRRFHRGWTNFTASYRLLADFWAVYDNSGDRPVLVERSP